MSVVEPGANSSKLVERVKNILTKPAETWDVIDAEPTTIGEIYKGYVVILAAIPAVIGLVVALFFAAGIGAVLGGVGGGMMGAVGAIVWAGVNYVIGLAAVYVSAVIIEALAPTFGGTKDRLKAFKLAAYSGTAVWVASLALLIPLVGLLVVIAGVIYALWIFYLGLPKLMKSPEEKTVPYMVTLIIVGLVISLVVGAISAPLQMMTMGGLAHNAPTTVNIPGGKASVDLGKLEAASKQMEQAARQIESGEGVDPADPEMLKGFLPAEVAGYARGEVSSASGGAGGITGVQAKGVYTKGDARLTLTITDLGAAGALAGIAGSFNINSSNESNGRYEKIGKVDGRMTTETYDRTSGHGEYGVLVGDRFMVQAQGDGVDMSALKAAVAAVQPSRLEGLAEG